eukprot:gene9522-biopygen6734
MCQIKIGKSQSEWECLGTLVGTKLAQKTVYELTVEFSTGSEVITMSTSRAGTILSRDGAPCLWDEFEGDQVANVCFHDKQLHEAVAAQFSERRVAPTEPEEIDSVSDVDDDTVPWRLATELESVREEVALETSAARHGRAAVHVSWSSGILRRQKYVSGFFSGCQSVGRRCARSGPCHACR